MIISKVLIVAAVCILILRQLLRRGEYKSSLVIRIKRTFPNIVRACICIKDFLGRHFIYKQGYG